jgi:hypothetical protein
MDFLSGQQPAACARCWRDEDAGIPSKRMLDNEHIFKNQVPNVNDILVLSMSFGNTCNLACGICSSRASSRWSSEEAKLKPYFPDIVVHQHNKFYKDPEFIQSITDRIKKVQHIEIPGGEPLLADQQLHHTFLSNLLDCDPENISLHYTTNVTRFPSAELLGIWSRFKQVDIQLSIDGTQDKFEYNRWPAVWSDVQVNIGRYLELNDSCSNIKLSISHSVSVFTVYYLPEFIVWCVKNRLPTPYLGLISDPKHLNITVLPPETKNIIAQRFRGIALLQPIVSAMNAADDSHLLDTTMKYVKILDRHRENDFPAVFPELYQLLGKSCQTLYQQY